MFVSNPAQRARRPLLVLALLGACLFSTAAWSHDVRYQGRATGIQGTVQLTTASAKVLLADVGMACDGSPREEVLLNARNPKPIEVQANEVRAFTRGADDVAQAESGVQALKFGVPGLTITAEQIQSFAHAECMQDESVKASGGSTFSGLTVNGQTIAVNGSPNQTINVPNVAKIVINEQVKYSREFRAVGLHVMLLGNNDIINGDVKIAAARAKIGTCDR